MVTVPGFPGCKGFVLEFILRKDFASVTDIQILNYNRSCEI
jgi:hypothetical protein